MPLFLRLSKQIACAWTSSPNKAWMCSSLCYTNKQCNMGSHGAQWSGTSIHTTANWCPVCLRGNANHICLYANSTVLDSALCKWDFTQRWTGQHLIIPLYTIVYILFNFKKTMRLSFVIIFYLYIVNWYKSMVCEAIVKSCDKIQF